jgi:hypothetical protein
VWADTALNYLPYRHVGPIFGYNLRLCAQFQAEAGPSTLMLSTEQLMSAWSVVPLVGQLSATLAWCGKAAQA